MRHIASYLTCVHKTDRLWHQLAYFAILPRVDQFRLIGYLDVHSSWKPYGNDSKESRVAGDQRPSGTDSPQSSASTESARLRAATLPEPLDWIGRRLRQRSCEASRESDLNRHGIETVLRWIAEDEHVFEQKYRSHISHRADAEEPKEFSIVAEQLYRLRYRCYSVLVGGNDPGKPDASGREGNGRDMAYTCPIPKKLPSIATLQTLDMIDSELSNDELRSRFAVAGDAILGVANWILNGEFDVTKQNPVSD